MAIGLDSLKLAAESEEGDEIMDRSEGNDIEDNFRCCTRARMAFPAAASELVFLPYENTDAARRL
jgi:hypothetical protein